jgi:hypothetical protein
VGADPADRGEERFGEALCRVVDRADRVLHGRAEPLELAHQDRVDERVHRTDTAVEGGAVDSGAAGDVLGAGAADADQAELLERGVEDCLVRRVANEGRRREQARRGHGESGTCNTRTSIVALWLRLP